MRKLLNGFNENDIQTNEWYDLREDWTLIESSLAKQYGIRIRHEADIPWAEFCTLVAGLMPDTPLGQIVEIRMESDPEKLKSFSTSQMKIHDDWGKRQAHKLIENPEQFNKDMNDMSKMLESMFGKG